jgi:hypothetical protein
MWRQPQWLPVERGSTKLFVSEGDEPILDSISALRGEKKIA